MKFISVFDWHVLLVAALACAATYLCLDANIAADLPTSLIAMAIVFPIVFSINAAYTRREEALRYLGLVRANIASIYFAHRDWVADADGSHRSRAADLGKSLYGSICEALAAEPDAMAAARLRVREDFSRFSRSIEALREAGLSSTEVSRVNNYLNLALTDFERLRAISDYRTPGSLRAYSKVYLNIFPMLYAPLYASIGQEAGLTFGYAVAIAFALVLVGLDNIQDALENPFDGVGVDDVSLEIETETYWLSEPDNAETRTESKLS